jgi:hypothetical protein
MSGKQYGAHARVPICRACGNPFVPPGYDRCCSVRCVQYLEVARQPVLGDPLFCQRDEPIKCWGCEVSFISRGIRYCPECWDRSRATEAVGVGTGLAPATRACRIDRVEKSSADNFCHSRAIFVRTYEPIKDRNPRSRCHW